MRKPSILISLLLACALAACESRGGVFSTTEKPFQQGEARKYGAIATLTSTMNLSTGFSGGGYPSGQPWTSGPVYNTPSPGQQGFYTVTASATTTIAVPSTALWVRIDPPASSSMQKNFKSVSGDTGTPIPKQGNS